MRAVRSLLGELKESDRVESCKEFVRKLKESDRVESCKEFVRRIVRCLTE